MPCKQDDVDLCLKHVSWFAEGTNSLIVLDDCASSQSVKNRTSELVKLGFSAGYMGISTIVITQQLCENSTSIAKPYRENISKVVTFYNPSTKDTNIILDDYLANESETELAYAGKINYIAKYIKKASEKTLESIYKDYEKLQLENTNNQLTDILIAKFSELMGALEAVKDTEVFEKELAENKLLRKDLKKLVGYVTPYIPSIGIPTGGITV
ncbi:Hypothetical predicted protein [Paramuricea clavata]|uniref:Uncharacterized protein n=1 Tax=Paramuricea clavata TaxID=317549 RepID=A0A6S7FIY3_PARCT|nr:Hypothetical predicted protein [Paramuricea clavata]